MNDLWYKKLGFYNNPFSIKPGMYDNELVAYDMPFIYKKIEKGEILFLEGEYGTGKTTILKNIITQFRGKNKIIYYSFNTESGFDLNKLLDGANTAIRRVAGLKVKNVIMLLDEVHTMKSADAKRLLRPYKDGVVKSIIFVSHDYGLTNFPEDYEPLLKGNIIRTVDLTSKEAVALIRRRIGNIDLLTDNMISKVFMLSGKNPRRLLEFSEDVCRYAVEIGDLKVTDYHVDEVLGRVIKEKQKKARVVVPVKKPHVEEKQEDLEPPRPQVKAKAAKPTIAVPKPAIQEKKELISKAESKADKKLAEAKAQLQEDGYIDIKELPQKDSKEKKFKINKLVGEEGKNSLGTIAESEEPEEKPKEIKVDDPEYKIYFVDE